MNINNSLRFHRGLRRKKIYFARVIINTLTMFDICARKESSEWLLCKKKKKLYSSSKYRVCKRHALDETTLYLQTQLKSPFGTSSRLTFLFFFFFINICCARFFPPLIAIVLALDVSQPVALRRWHYFRTF